MTQYKSADDAAKGSPNLESVQVLQENWSLDEINASIRVAKTSITASGSSGVDVLGIPQGSEIIDIVVHSNATSGSGTVQLSVGDGGVAISDAITMETADAATRVGSIDQTYKIVGADGLTLTTNGDTDLGDVYITYKK